MLNEKTAGRRMTRQRQAIMDFLAKTNDHPTAEMVYAAVRKQLPEISLGTVYRNLQLLVDEGLAREIDRGRGSSRFDGKLAQHSHFFCQSCGRVFDLPACQADLPPDLPGQMLWQRTDFFGICQDCLPNGEQKPTEGCADKKA